MPRRRELPSLYDLALRLSYGRLYDACLSYEDSPATLNFTENINAYLVRMLPESILNDLLEMHFKRNTDGHVKTSDERCFQFYKLVLHPRVREFIARDFNLSLYVWRPIFEKFFAELTTLNLSMSCTDDLMRLIPLHCPQLEVLKATCKFKRMFSFGNAMAFSLTITDVGLACLSDCKRLRELTVNEARSRRFGLNSSITHDGLRQLLRDVPTMERINCSDSGIVIATDMTDVQRLRLRVVRHFNATSDTLKEIFRLCLDLRELYLKFFDCVQREAVILTLLERCPRRMHTIDCYNLTIGTNFTTFVSTLGSDLSVLTLINVNQKYTFENVLAIGKHCPRLQTFCLGSLDTSNEIVTRQPNVGQFRQLETLNLFGDSVHLETVLQFCTVNAEQLTCVKLSDKVSRGIIDDLFIDQIDLHTRIKHLDVSTNMEFTLQGIRTLVAKYDSLEYLKAICVQDSTLFRQEMKDENFNFLFNSL